MNEEYMKEMIFEIYSAGYVDGFNKQDANSQKDLKSDFERWYKNLLKLADMFENKNMI